jgi:hypothetical protein
VQVTYLQATYLRTLDEKRNKTTALLNERRRSALQLRGQNKRRERDASARTSSVRNSAPGPLLPPPRETKGAKRRKGAIARIASVRKVKDRRRSAKKRMPRPKLGERNEWRRHRQRLLVRPSPPRLRDASPMRDVRAVVFSLLFSISLFSHALLF